MPPRRSVKRLSNRHVKNLIDLADHFWRCGLDNNRSMVLAAIFAYQILLSYNHR